MAAGGHHDNALSRLFDPVNGGAEVAVAGHKYCRIILFCGICHFKRKLNIKIVFPSVAARAIFDFLDDFRTNDVAVDLQHIKKLALRGIVFVLAGVDEAFCLLPALLFEIAHEFFVRNSPAQRALAVEHILCVNKDVYLASDKLTDHTIMI